MSRLLFAIALTGMLAAFASVAQAALYEVTSTLDDGGGGTLREVIATAVASGTDDTITFGAGLDGETIDIRANGPITITTANALTIDATCVDVTIGGGGDAGEILVITGTGAIAIIGVTFINAEGTGESRAVYANAAGDTTAALTMTDCTIDGCDAYGAAVSVGETELHLEGCHFVGNTGLPLSLHAPFPSPSAALSICDGSATIEDCTFEGNGGAAEGAAIYAKGDIASLTVSGSTFIDNSGGPAFFDNTGSGAIYIELDSGSWSITNCVFCGNHGLSGGALTVQSGDGVIRHVTMSGNSADNGGGISIGDAVVSIHNSIVAGNFDDEPGGGDRPDVEGAFVSLGGNVIGDVADATGFHHPTDQAGNADEPIDARLAPLGDYGGATLGFELRPGSPAIDAGVDGVDGEDLPETDQRGGARVAGDAPDAGAIEQVWITVDSLSGDAGVATSLPYALAAANASKPWEVIDARGVAGTIVLDAPLAIEDGVTLLGPGTAALTLDGQETTGLVQIVVPDVAAWFEGIAFTDGHSASGPAGIACAVDTELTVSDCTFTGCVTDTGAGGAVGVAAADATVVLTRVHISACNAGSGGGIAIDLADGWAAITACTIDSCGASTGDGGGAWLAIGVAATLAAINCTISDNSAPAGAGGGVFAGGSGYVHFAHCTIASNNADGAGGGLASTGGAAQLFNALVAGNQSANGPGHDIRRVAGVLTSWGGNLIGNADDANVTWSLNDQTGATAEPIDARLEPLADNGGSTPTHALQPGSPAINGGTTGAASAPPATDQRGTPRPAGDGFDAGAFEQAGELVVAPTGSPGPFHAGKLSTVLLAHLAGSLFSVPVTGMTVELTLDGVDAGGLYVVLFRDFDADGLCELPHEAVATQLAPAGPTLAFSFDTESVSAPGGGIWGVALVVYGDDAGTVEAAISAIATTVAISGPALDGPTVSFTGAPAELVLLAAPAEGVAGKPFSVQPVIEIRDASGNRVVGDNATTLTATTSDGSGLIGTTSAIAEAGVVTFAGLGPAAAGSWTLQFGDGAGLAIASSEVTVGGENGHAPVALLALLLTLAVVWRAGRRFPVVPAAW